MICINRMTEFAPPPTPTTPRPPRKAKAKATKPRTPEDFRRGAFFLIGHAMWDMVEHYTPSGSPLSFVDAINAYQDQLHAVNQLIELNFGPDHVIEVRHDRDVEHLAWRTVADNSPILRQSATAVTLVQAYIRQRCRDTDDEYLATFAVLEMLLAEMWTALERAVKVGRG